VRPTPRALAAAVLALLLGRDGTAAGPYTRGCPEADRHALGVRAARAAVADRCDCAGSATPAHYLRCAAREAKARARAGALPRACRRVVVAFDARSTCGRRQQAVCCRPGATGRNLLFLLNGGHMSGGRA
jgi:hypothetical protein